MTTEDTVLNEKNHVAAESEDVAAVRLASLTAVEYDKVRRDEAKKLGVKVKTLDSMVKAARLDAGASGRLPFAEHEPADEPVNPSELLEAIAALIKMYIVLEPEQADAAALWVLHTYLIDVFDVSPIAIISAPERACAKTLFQTILGRLVYRPLFASNASTSAVFRAIELWGATLLIDEADTFFRDNAELHGIVNAGYKRGGFVLRSEASGDNFEPMMFSVYSPKSIAGIALEKHLPDATMSRGIVFAMRRKLAHEKVERFRGADDEIFLRLGSMAARFAEDYAEQVRGTRPNLPDEMSDRAQDNWEPLLAIAMCAGPVWLQRATAVAIKMSAASEAQGSTGNDLLADVKEILVKLNMGKDNIPTSALIQELTEDEDMGWGAYNRGKPLTPRQLAKLLNAYDIKPKTVRQKTAEDIRSYGETPKGYVLADFEDAFKRYLKPDAAKVPLELAEQREQAVAPATPHEVAATAQQGAVHADGVSSPAFTPAAAKTPAPVGRLKPPRIAGF